jgi:cation transport ATPase
VLKTAVIDMRAFGCATCAYAIERIGRKQPGVREVDVNLASFEITVDYEEGHEESLDAILKYINMIGHDATVRGRPGCEPAGEGIGPCRCA